MLNRFKVWMQRSGIRYLLATGNPLNGTEMMDSLNPFRKVIEYPRYPLARIYRSNVHQGLRDTFDLLIGNHYDLYLTGKGRLGILDIFILPLISRKIIYNLGNSIIRDPNVERTVFDNIKSILRVLTWGILTIPATLIEMTRFTVAAIVTAYLSPIILAVHAIAFFKAKKLNEDVRNTKITTVNESDSSTNNINQTLGDWMNQNNVTDIELIKYDADKKYYYRKMDHKFFSSEPILDDYISTPNFKLQPKSYRLSDNENLSPDPFEELNVGQHVRVR